MVDFLKNLDALQPTDGFLNKKDAQVNLDALTAPVDLPNESVFVPNTNETHSLPSGSIRTLEALGDFKNDADFFNNNSFTASIAYSMGLGAKSVGDVTKDVATSPQGFSKGTARGRHTYDLNTLYGQQLAGDTSLLLQNKIDRKIKNTPTADTKGLEDIFRAVGEQVPQLVEVAKAGGVGAVVGGVVGAAGGFVAGNVLGGALLPEEAVTVPAGARLGVKLGGGVGASNEMFHQMSSAAYGELKAVRGENGEQLDPTAIKIAAYSTGAVGAALELIPVSRMIKLVPASDIIFKKLGKKTTDFIRIPFDKAASPTSQARVMRQFSKDITRISVLEVGTEEAQLATSEAATAMAKYFSAGDFEQVTAWELANKSIDTAVETIKSAPFIVGGFATPRLVVDTNKVRKATKAAKGQKVEGSFTPFIQKKVDTANGIIERLNTKIEAVGIKETSDTDKKTEVAALELEKTQVTEALNTELEIKQQEEIVGQAKEIKKQIKNLPDVDVNKPSSFKKALGRIPVSLSQFIKKEGGIQDAGGNLKAMDITNKSLIGIIAKSARTKVTEVGTVSIDNQIDVVKQRVFDAGYFPDKNNFDEISNDELFSAIEQDINSDKIYSLEDQVAIDDIAASSDLLTQYDEVGITPDMSVEEITSALRDDLGLPAFTQDTIVVEEITAKQTMELDKKETLNKEQSFAVSLSKMRELEEKNGFFDAPAAFVGNLSKGIDRLIVPISERLGDINHKLKIKIRKYEHNSKVAIQRDEKTASGFLKKFKKLSKEARQEVDFALKSRDTDIVKSVMAKHNMTNEYNKLRPMLNRIHAAAKNVGVDVGYIDDFFPSHVEDVQGLRDTLKKKKYWTVIEQAIENIEKTRNKKLTENERAEVSNKLIRGLSQGGVSLSKSGIFKGRTIDEVSAEINKFYASSDQALIRYIVIANESIETSALFGRGVDLNGVENINDSIGKYVTSLAENGEITSAQIKEVSEIFEARFNRGRMGAVADLFKNFAYLETMGSNFGSTITQISDLAIASYQNGLLNTASALAPAAANKTVISLEDIGVTKIAAEFEGTTWSSKAVDLSFTITGLKTIDRFGKRVLIQGAYNKFVKKANKGNKEFTKEMNRIFGSEASTVINDLKTGVISDDVTFLLANELMEVQPIALSEMSEQHLKSGNGKIFFILKSFTIKQLSIYRRDVYKEIASGDPKRVAKGLTNFVTLLSFMALAGASRDWLWDMLTGQEPDELEDIVVANVLKAFGLSKYNLDQMSRPYQPLSPADVMFEIILPPRKTANNLWRDYQDQKNGRDKDFKDLRVLRSIPVGGELYWFWFGGVNKSRNNNSFGDVPKFK